MIRNAHDLSPTEKAAFEVILGRPLQDGEAVSVRAFKQAKLSPQERLEVLRRLRAYFAEVDATRQLVSESEEEDVIDEAMRSVRLDYRPHR